LNAGGTLGGLLSYFAFDGSYQSVPQTIIAMNAVQKQQLAQKVYVSTN